MSSVYELASQMLKNWHGEDEGSRSTAQDTARKLVDAIVNDIKVNGFPAVDRAAAHDSPGEEARPPARMPLRRAG